jgi:glycosyltransferase involved in cell wall biosynthesis
MTEKKMKVVLVSGGYPPVRCGIGDYTGNLADRLNRLGIDVEIVTSSYLGIVASGRGVKVKPCVKSWKATAIADVLTHIMEDRPDIVHIQYPNIEYKKNLSTNILPFLIKRNTPGIKVVETMHEPINLLKFLGKVRMMVSMAFADACIFVEKENYNNLPFYIKVFIKNKKIAFIPIASNIERVSLSNAERVAIRKRYIKGDGMKLIMTFGFINNVKGYEDIIDIYDPEKHVWVHVGQIDSQDQYQAHFMKKADEKGIKIFFTGHLAKKDVAKHLLAADACVFPFKGGVTDRHGTFLAAASQGAYTVAYHARKKGYIKEDNAYYIMCGDKERLKKAIEFKTPVKMEKPDLPGWESIAKAHVELYRNL